MILENPDDFYSEIAAAIGTSIIRANMNAEQFVEDVKRGNYAVKGADEYEVNDAIASKIEDYLDFAEETVDLLNDALNYVRR